MYSEYLGKLHFKCRGEYYPRTNESVKRFKVPDENVPWDVPFPDYAPVEHNLTAHHPQSITVHENSPKFNAIDGVVDRRSHNGPYKVIDNKPLNPIGRTGICGRGCLPRWGPTHAADAAVSRWKRRNDGVVIFDDRTGRPILQCVLILRRDCGEWAIPGGKVDPGETCHEAAKREFREEVLNDLENALNASQRTLLDTMFSDGIEVFKGYVDDPRNTDNAWLETMVINFHDDTGEIADKLYLHAGDDAIDAQWTDLSSNLTLYADHKCFLEKTALLHEAHW